MRQTRAYHAPVGNPCSQCTLPASVHYPSHNPEGDPCKKCGAPWANHKSHRAPYIVGIDGEGQGRDNHRYMLLAYANESGSVRRHIEAKTGEGLSTVECLEFILNAPKLARFFSYAFNYDLTKILTDLDERTLYLLFRPELRPNLSRKKAGPKPIVWNGYKFNLISSKFIVSKGNKRVVIWDTFKFYQAKFTAALTEWLSKEAEPDTMNAVPDSTCKTGWRLWERPEWGHIVDRMAHMKDLRQDFDKLGRDEIREYCYQECELMATLTRKLINAHNKAGLTLRSYYGAGSTSGAILKSIGIDKAHRTGPASMDAAVAAAFFGGRFENSVIGEITGHLWEYDISSAYPYQLYQLPCLECGTWEYTKERKGLGLSRHALVQYKLHPSKHKYPWGPFPFRIGKSFITNGRKNSSGSIVFPSQSGGGWIWRDEYLAGEKLFDNVEFIGAWVYKTECNHRPFEEIPRYYVERLRIGKEGPGIVIKLACNGCYGKLAQSLGIDPPFQSWIWAGMITSGTRAQILDVLGLHKDWSNMYVIATDGIKTRERLQMPVPIDTGTMTEHKKPLGGWEETPIKNGIFVARPGIYFPLNPSKDDMKKVRARGLGRKSLYDNWERVINAWRANQPSVVVGNVSRFHGAKSSISKYIGDDGKPAFRRSPLYGQWSNKEIEMTFDPMPKRESINADGTLKMRAMPMDMVSAPYNRSLVSQEAIQLKLAMLELLEQPDGGDYADYTE